MSRTQTVGRYQRSLVRATEAIEDARRSADPKALHEAVSVAANVLGALVRVGPEDRPTEEYRLGAELLASKLQDI